MKRARTTPATTAKEKKGYYNTCPLCGANLDPGETCDCQMTIDIPTKSASADAFEGKEVKSNVGNHTVEYRNREGCPDNRSIDYVYPGNPLNALGFVLGHAPSAKTLAAFDKVWEHAPDLDRKIIERGIVGKIIAGIYPLYDMKATRKGMKYTVSGFSIAVITPSTGRVTTIDIDTTSDHDVRIDLFPGYIQPEELTE